MADQDEMNQPPKPKRGRPPKGTTGKVYGHETRAPGKRGKPRKYEETALDGVEKPLSQMSPEERLAYDALRMRRSRARKKAETPTVPVKPLVFKPAPVLLTARPERVYARTQPEAEAIAGPNAVAVLDAKIILPVELWERTRRTAAALRATGTNIDASYIVELNLKATLDALEEAYNDGKPFEAVEAPAAKKRPIPRARKAQEEK